MWNFLALTFCLMVGTAGLPHILTRYYTTPSVREARTSVGWSLFFIFLLYFTAPAYAAFARYTVYQNLVGSKISELPAWITLWKPAGLFEVVDKLGDGVVQFADFVVKSTDFVVLATPEIAGLPFVITGLVMAGGLAAALSTADGLLLTISNAISHDLYYNIINPKASLTKRLIITKILLIVTALIAAWVATARLGIIVEMVAWAFSLAGASFFPALVLGIWWKRTNRPGAVSGMIVGFGLTLYYLLASRFFGVSWFQTSTVASAVFGLPANFLVTIVVSLLTAPPSQAVQELVASVRYPRTGQSVKARVSFAPESE
jgi:cation/acetate symporter